MSKETVWGAMGIILILAGLITVLGLSVRITFHLIPTIIAGVFAVIGINITMWAFNNDKERYY